MLNIDYGDIVKIKNKNFVVVSKNNDNNMFFAAIIDAFIRIERSHCFTYSYANSGWYEITSDIEKVGHITLFE